MPWYGVQGALLRDGLMGGVEVLPYSAQSVMSVGEEDLLSWEKKSGMTDDNFVCKMVKSKDEENKQMVGVGCKHFSKDALSQDTRPNNRPHQLIGWY